MKKEQLKKENYRLAPIGLFHTYETVEELQEYVDQLNEEQRALASLIMSLTWNTCAFLTKGE